MRQYPLERWTVSDRIELLVNTHNGNLMITTRALTVQGTGQRDLSLSQIYNSYQDYGSHGDTAFGVRTSVNTGSDVGLVTQSTGDVILRGPSGFCVHFEDNPDGSFNPAPGLSAGLAKLAGGGYVLTFNDSNEQWLFNANGWLLSRADRKSVSSILWKSEQLFPFRYSFGLC